MRRHLIDAAEAFRLRTEEHLSDRKISQRLGCSRVGVTKALRRYQAPAPTAEAPAPVPAKVEMVQHTPEEEAALNAQFEHGIRVFEEHQNVKFDQTSRETGDYTLRFWRLDRQNELELIAV